MSRPGEVCPVASGDAFPGFSPDFRAALERLSVKQFEEERGRTLTLLVDASASLDWGGSPAGGGGSPAAGWGDESDREAHKGRFARRLAAALAWVALSRHDAVRAFLL